MTKFFKMTVKGVASLALLWLGIMLAIVGVRLCLPIRLSINGIVSGLAFVSGLLLFRWWKFTPVYIFGHELTHWITAKLFFKRTGKFRVGWTRGFVEIANANVWITLAPYVVPFYFMLVLFVFGLSQFFVYPSPQWATVAFLLCAGLGYAYHCVLTVYAIGLSQSDLKLYGEFFSVSLIIAGNVLFLVFGLLLCNGQWRRAFNMFCELCSWQLNAVASLLCKIKEWNQ